MPPDSDKLHKSSLGFNYPKNRDVFHKNGSVWLQDRRENDGAEGLWRIHDDIYDLTKFIKSHPGGQDWLKLTKGTDITEAFEAHHLFASAEQLLPKFHVKKASTKRSYPYTFNEDGFYRTLKRNARDALKHTKKNHHATSDWYTDGSLFSALLFAAISCYFQSYILAIISGMFLTFTTIASHNYFHRRDNFRMYYFDICFLSSREWRISHAMSHHLYTNSIDDMEISMFEPIFEYMPKRKGFRKYLTWLYAPLVWITFLHVTFARTCYFHIAHNEKISKEQLLPFVVPTVMYIFGCQSFWYTMFMWQIVLLSCSTIFLFVGTNAAHHHPKIFHDGDTPRNLVSLDWGLHQLDTVMDRVEINGNHWLVLTNFGEHALHHLFPTLDHGLLQDIYPIFQKTSRQFGVYVRMTTQLNLVKGQFAQLIREEPNPNPPLY